MVVSFPVFVVAGGVTVVSVWLLSQANPGPVMILLGALLGFSLGAPLAGQALAGAPTAAALAGTAVLAATAAFEPKVLYWLAAVLGLTTSLRPPTGPSPPQGAWRNRGGRAEPAIAAPPRSPD